MNMNKSTYHTFSFAEKDNRRKYWLSKTVPEKLSAAWYLICSAYDINNTADKRIDKKEYKIRNWDE